jgi:hypothetical protein
MDAQGQMTVILGDPPPGFHPAGNLSFFLKRRIGCRKPGRPAAAFTPAFSFARVFDVSQGIELIALLETPPATQHDPEAKF